jgi:hypothetical protein
MELSQLLIALMCLKVFTTMTSANTPSWKNLVLLLSGVKVESLTLRLWMMVLNAGANTPSLDLTHKLKRLVTVQIVLLGSSVQKLLQHLTDVLKDIIALLHLNSQ